MRVSGGSYQEYKLGEQVQGDYAMQCLIKHDKAGVGSPLLEAAPVQVFETYHAARLWTISILFLYICPVV